MIVSSEAIKAGLQIPENMTPEEFKAWRNSLDPDAMGFDGTEAPDEDC